MALTALPGRTGWGEFLERVRASIGSFVVISDGYNQDHKDHPLLPYQYHGSLYHCVGAKHGYLRPVGTWNYEEIEVRGNKIKVTLNGHVIVDANLDSVTDPAVLKKHPGLARSTGHIGFLGHGSQVDFRNIRVKDLVPQGRK